MKELKAIYLITDESVLVDSDWTAECEEKVTTVATSTWEGQTLTLSSAALTGNKATVIVQPATCGEYVLTNTATLANGEIVKSVREVIVQ